MTNPMMMIMQAMRQGMNPMQMLQQQAANNPQMRQLQQIVGNRSPQEQRKVAENMLQQRGLTYEQAEQEISRRFGLQPPNR